MLRTLPSCFIAFGAWYWLGYRGVSAGYFAFLLALPVAFTLLVVNPAGRLRLWSWSRPGSVRAWVWAGFNQCLFFLNARLLSDPSVGLPETALQGALIAAVFGTLYDILAIDGRIVTVYNRAHHKGWGAIRSACSYGFAFFGAFGLVACALAKLAWAPLAQGASIAETAAICGGGGLALCLPFGVFLLVASRGRKRLDARRKAFAATDAGL